MTNSTPNTLLASTACWTAAVRARESQREDRLFNDPFAAALAGQAGADWIASRAEAGTISIVLRTRYFDDFLLRVAAQNGIRQIVLVAAGLDTRAYRLAWPEGTRIFELDQPAVLERKEEILARANAQPACLRAGVGVDLARNWKYDLARAGFAPHKPSAFLLEGLLFYLPNETAANLLETVSELAAPQSWLGCDVVNSATFTSPFTKPWVDMQASMGAPWVGAMDDPAGVLAAWDGKPG